MSIENMEKQIESLKTHKRIRTFVKTASHALP